jgi:hypothetical protein
VTLSLLDAGSIVPSARTRGYASAVPVGLGPIERVLPNLARLARARIDHTKAA